MRISFPFAIWKLGAAVVACAWFAAPVAAEVPFRLTGKGWSDYGKVIHSTDTLFQNLNNNDIQGPGAQFTATADLGAHWEGAFGIGGYLYHDSPGNDVQAKLMQFYFRSFITEARVSYFAPDKQNPWLRFTFGNFNYNYNPDVKNLGLYLLRGSVYPGFLQSGFLHPATDDTRGDVLGANIHHKIGPFSHDLLLANERDLPPSFDWSLAYVAKLQAGPAFTLGAGANFHRLLPANGKLTTPYNSGLFTSHDSALAAQGNAHPYQYRFSEGRIDSSSGQARYVPTVKYTHQGIKLMAMAAFDPKRALGFGEALGPEDLKIYAEAAMIGVSNYGSVYNKPLERIPWVVGFNIPTFGLLDVMALEVEYYGARYRNDIAKLGTVGQGLTKDYSPLPSPVPLSYEDYDPIVFSGGVDSATGRLYRDSLGADGNPVFDSLGNSIKVPGDIQIRGTGLDIQNLTADNWKWSLYLQKTIRGHIRIIAQAANDHYRPEPRREAPYQTKGGTAEAFSSLSDWYFMFRLGYFF